MEQEIKQYTVSVYTENNIGLLNRISAIFQRRHINIESMNISQSEIEGVSRFTILVNMYIVQTISVITGLNLEHQHSLARSILQPLQKVIPT